MGIELTPAAKALLSERGYDPVLGARPLRRTIQREIEDSLSEKILFSELKAGQIVIVDAEGTGPEAQFTLPGRAQAGRRAGRASDRDRDQAGRVGRHQQRVCHRHRGTAERRVTGAPASTTDPAPGHHCLGDRARACQDDWPAAVAPAWPGSAYIGGRGPRPGRRRPAPSSALARWARIGPGRVQAGRRHRAGRLPEDAQQPAPALAVAAQVALRRRPGRRGRAPGAAPLAAAARPGSWRSPAWRPCRPVRPSSMTATDHRAARPGAAGSSDSASRTSAAEALRGGSSSPRTRRARTRRTFVSRTAWRCPKAKLATAAAV